MRLIFLSLFVLTQFSSAARAEERSLVRELEYLPNRAVAVVDGHMVDLTTASPNFRCEGVDLLYARGKLGGEEVRFVRARSLWMGASLEPGAYEAHAVLVGKPGTTAPMEIWSFGTPLVTDLEVPEDGRKEVTFSFEVVPGGADPYEVGILVWKPKAGDRVSLETLRIRRTGEASTEPGDSARDDGDPTESELLRSQLRRIADHLLTYQVPHFNGFDYSSTAWWEVSMAVRTLLASARILDEDRYHEAARRAMETFLASQREDGGFCAYLEGMQDPTAVTRKPRACDTSNRADVGSITTCLSLFALSLPEGEREPYLEAHQRYLETQIYGHAFEDGSYPNGLFEGRRYDTSYSVATGTTALSLSAYYAATGDARALQTAEEAARFLARTFEERGTVMFHSHDRIDPERIPSTWHHNVYYILEGMLAVYQVTEDPALKGEIETAFRRYLHGPEGVANVLPTDQWITVGTRRNLSKANGMLGVLIEMRRMLDADPELDRWIAAGTSALGDPESCSTYAVLLPPYRASSEKTTICTAFAGLSIATAIEPGILFPTRERRP